MTFAPDVVAWILLQGFRFRSASPRLSSKLTMTADVPQVPRITRTTGQTQRVAILKYNLLILMSAETVPCGCKCNFDPVM